MLLYFTLKYIWMLHTAVTLTDSVLGTIMSTSTFIKKPIRAHTSSCGNCLKTMPVSFLQISHLSLDHVVHHCLIHLNSLLHYRIINKLTIHRIFQEPYFSIWWQSGQSIYECLEETHTDTVTQNHFNYCIALLHFSAL